MTFRDRGTLFMILFVPLIQLVLFAYAIHMDVKNIPMVVADQSMGPASRSYVDALVQSGYFEIASKSSQIRDRSSLPLIGGMPNLDL